MTSHLFGLALPCHTSRQLQALYQRVHCHSMTSQKIIQRSNPQVNSVLRTGLRWGCRVKHLLCLNPEGSGCQCVAENQATTLQSTNVDFGVQLWQEYSNYSLETLVINISPGTSTATSRNFGGSYQTWKVLFLEEQKKRQG